MSTHDLTQKIMASRGLSYEDAASLAVTHGLKALHVQKTA